MTSSTSFNAFAPEALPAVVRRYLDAQKHRSRDSVADAFAVDAIVVDDGSEFRGNDAIRAWLGQAATEFTYTTTFSGQTSTGVDRWAVLAHLEGDFPGGRADLAFRFRLADDRIAELTIEPVAAVFAQAAADS